jgi:N-methylhydantoinase B
VVRRAALDLAATQARRAEILRERLGGAEPEPEIEPPAGARPVGDVLHVVDGRWWSNGHDLGGVGENYREQCVLRETPAWRIGPEFEAEDVEIADQFVLREYLCPATGYRLDAEIARATDPVFQDIRLEG